eukprot:2898129-Amphidinium_carterae.1
MGKTETQDMNENISDVLADLLNYVIIIMTKFRMVAEQVHRLRVHRPRAGPYHKVQQQADETDLGSLPCYDQVYSA